MNIVSAEVAQDRAADEPAPSSQQSAATLAPRWCRRASEAGLLRRLPKETVGELMAHGLLEIVAPARHGGLQEGWPQLVQTARVAARACPSTAWAIALVGGHAALASRLPALCQEEMYAPSGPKLFASASVTTNARIEVCPGGYLVSGRWRFCSAVSHADWVMLSARWSCDGQDGSPEMQMLVVQQHQLSIDDCTWQTTGMRGTGSFDVQADRVFVPVHRLIAWKDLLAAAPEGAMRHPDHYLAQMPLLPYVSSWVVGPILGCAEGAYELYAQGARKYRDARTGLPLAEMHLAQERLAESAAELECAALLLDSLGVRLHEAGVQRRPLTAVQTAAAVRRDAAYLSELCRRAIERLVRHAGSGVFFEDDGLNRRWNDLQFMVAHADVQWDGAMRLFGELALKSLHPLESAQ